MDQDELQREDSKIDDEISNKSKGLLQDSKQAIKEEETLLTEDIQIPSDKEDEQNQPNELAESPNKSENLQQNVVEKDLS